MRKILLALMAFLAIPVMAQPLGEVEPTDPASWATVPANKPFVLSWASRDVHYAQS